MVETLGFMLRRITKITQLATEFLGFVLEDFFLKIYLFTIEERERERQAEGEAGLMQGAGCGTQSWVSRITYRAEGGTKPLNHPAPQVHMFYDHIIHKTLAAAYLLFPIYSYPLDDSEAPSNLDVSPR